MLLPYFHRYRAVREFLLNLLDRVPSEILLLETKRIESNAELGMALAALHESLGAPKFGLQVAINALTIHHANIHNVPIAAVRLVRP